MDGIIRQDGLKMLGAVIASLSVGTTRDALVKIFQHGFDEDILQRKKMVAAELMDVVMQGGTSMALYSRYFKLNPTIFEAYNASNTARMMKNQCKMLRAALKRKRKKTKTKPQRFFSKHPLITYIYIYIYIVLFILSIREEFCAVSVLVFVFVFFFFFFAKRYLILSIAKAEENQATAAQNIGTWCQHARIRVPDSFAAEHLVRLASTVEAAKISKKKKNTIRAAIKSFHDAQKQTERLRNNFADVCLLSARSFLDVITTTKHFFRAPLCELTALVLNRNISIWSPKAGVTLEQCTEAQRVYNFNPLARKRCFVLWNGLFEGGHFNELKQQETNRGLLAKKKNKNKWNSPKRASKKTNFKEYKQIKFKLELDIGFLFNQVLGMQLRRNQILAHLNQNRSLLKSAEKSLLLLLCLHQKKSLLVPFYLTLLNPVEIQVCCFFFGLCYLC